MKRKLGLEDFLHRLIFFRPLRLLNFFVAKKKKKEKKMCLTPKEVNKSPGAQCRNEEIGFLELVMRIIKAF